MAAEKTGDKQRGRPFRPGVSGNPKGRPRGSRNKATILAQELLDGEAEALVRKAIELAMGGDTVALRLCLERLLPPTKDRPVKIKLPQVATAGQAARAMAQVLDVVAKGKLSPSEGRVIAGLIEGLRKSLEVEDLEKRVAELEALQATNKK